MVASQSSMSIRFLGLPHLNKPANTQVVGGIPTPLQKYQSQLG